MEIILRQNLKDDTNFILNSFMKSFRDNEQNKHIANRFYYDVLQAKLKRVLEQKDRAFVACNAEDPEQIFGYILYKKTADSLIIDYVYVKDIFRQQGLANALIAKVQPAQYKDVINTTLADTARKRAMAQKLKAQFCPFLLFDL